MCQSDISLEKYWVPQSGYFRLTTIVSLGMVITYGKLRFCHHISQDSEDKTSSTKEQNKRTVYEYFNNTFTSNFGSPDLSLPTITIDDRPLHHKIARYTPDLLPVAISVASKNYVSTLTNPSDLSQIFLLTSGDTNPPHEIIKDEPFHVRVKIGYCCRKHDAKEATKRQGYIAVCALIDTRNFITAMGVPGLIQRQRLASWNINIV